MTHKLFYKFSEEWEKDVKEFGKMIKQEFNVTSWVMPLLTNMAQQGHMVEKNLEGAKVDPKKWASLVVDETMKPDGRRVIVLTGDGIYNGLLKFYKFMVITGKDKPFKSFGEFIDKSIESAIMQVQNSVIQSQLQDEQKSSEAETNKIELEAVKSNFKKEILK